MRRAVLLTFLLALLTFQAHGQSITKNKWVVVFTLKDPKDKPFPPGPDMRINLLVDGNTEGEAAINAHKHMSEILTTQAIERLVFVEAQRKN
jgi:hypothetical protein